LQGVIRIESGIAVLVPFADLLYGLGFGLPHPPHIGIGAILITISVAALIVLTLLSTSLVKGV
jgi:hypothetical protein